MATPGVLLLWTGNTPCLRAFPLGLDGFVLGRETIDIETTDDRISRQHARVMHRNGRIIITDLGSRNGTYAGGHALIDKEVVMTPPCTIRTGRTVSLAVADLAPYQPASICTIERRGELVVGPS